MSALLHSFTTAPASACRRWILGGIVAATLVGLVPASALGRVGEKADEIRKRFGRPQSQPRKDTIVWLIEERDGPLLYTVTTNEKGISVAEGLKPLKQSTLPDELAQSFIREQLSMFPDSKTVRTVKPGESYKFSGQDFVCTETEVVALDDTNGLLVVWDRGTAKSVMAVTKEWLTRNGKR